MKKIFTVLVLLFTATNFWSQRSQIIAYIDMEYILENVPEYMQAQNTLDTKIAKWKNNLDKQERHIEANEKAILTKDLIEEKEEEIEIKQVELRRLESLYFGPNGNMFLVRKQLVKPIQDQVYNAIQSIAARKKYDFVFDKSSELVMLYSNKKYDISELVLSSIDRTRLSEEKKEKINKRSEIPTEDLTERQKDLIEIREEAKDKKVEAIEKRVEENKAKKVAIAEKRADLIKKREEQRKILREKKEALRKKKEEEKKENN
jgi:Skp family chaperone for outer membrane proteins